MPAKTESPSRLDEAERLLAFRRLDQWPREWTRMIARLPADEAMVFVEAVALLDARPHEQRATE